MKVTYSVEKLEVRNLGNVFAVFLEFDGQRERFAICYSFGEAESCGEAAVHAVLLVADYLKDKYENETISALCRHYEAIEQQTVKSYIK